MNVCIRMYACVSVCMAFEDTWELQENNEFCMCNNHKFPFSISQALLDSPRLHSPRYYSHSHSLTDTF